ncbi:hypothetical protein FRX31_030424 [Thalictrum thalictroides]|uniref:Uncharacterized protein n=1 Tax=Thalictrum thalictroides TaxID=46969 RepID=A0A7J6V5M3_THATH|nr:hypothetical protein FRX31_030424 [Thalictrum thalictroides]
MSSTRGVASIALSFPRLLKLAQSSMATEVVFPNEYLLHFQGQPTPDLEDRFVDSSASSQYSLASRIGLESITLPTQSFFKEIVSQIYTNCENLVALTMEGRVGFEEALAIVTFLPNIKKLVLCTSKLPRENLLLILAGCRELELLDVTNCRGFDAGDAGDTEILSKASHIKTFKSEGTT